MRLPRTMEGCNVMDSGWWQANKRHITLQEDLTNITSEEAEHTAMDFRLRRQAAAQCD